MIDEFELLVGTAILILSLFIKGKSIAVPLSVFTFIVSGMIPDAGFVLRVSVALNLLLAVFYIEQADRFMTNEQEIFLQILINRGKKTKFDTSENREF